VVWFYGPELRDPREFDFVGALTRAADEGAFPGVDPGDTACGALSKEAGPGVTVCLAVPRLTCERRWLLVSYEPGTEYGTPVLQSEWSSVLDFSLQPGAYDGPRGDGELWVSGIAATPSACAEWVSLGSACSRCVQ